MKNLRLVILIVLFVALLIPNILIEVRYSQVVAPTPPYTEIDLGRAENEKFILRGKLVSFAPSGDPIGEIPLMQNCSPCFIYLPLIIRNYPQVSAGSSGG